MKQSYSFLTCLCLFLLRFSFPGLAQTPTFKVLWTKTTNAKSLSFTPDGKRLVTGGSKISCLYTCGQIRVWDVKSSALLTDISNENLLGITQDIAISADGKTILSASGNTICDEGCYADKAGLFSFGLNGTLQQYLRTYDRNAYAIAMSPDMRTIASSYYTSGLQNPLYLYDTAYRLQRTLPSSPDEIYDIAFTPDGKNILTSNAAGTISVYDLASGALLRTMEHGGFDGGGNQMYIDISADGKYVVSAGNGSNNVVKVWRIADGTLLQTLDTHLTFGLNYVKARFTPDGKYIVAGLIVYETNNSGKLIAWNVADGTETSGFTPAPGTPAYGGITDVAFSPVQNGRYYFAFASGDYNANKYNVVVGVINSNVSSSDKSGQPMVVSLKPAALSNGIAVVANPFTDHIDIRFRQPLSSQVAIRLMDMTGSVVLQQSSAILSAQTLRLNISNAAIAKGIYILSVSSAGMSYQTKVFKQ